MPPRPPTSKQSSPLLLPSNDKFLHLRSHLRSRSTTLLQKKPQILLMKWNNFIEQYHFWKQINTINSSLCFCNTVLKNKKQQNCVIKNVEYIVSQQVSVEQKLEDVLDSRQRKRYAEQLRHERVIENKQIIVQSKELIRKNQNEKKIVISVKINEDIDAEKSEQRSQKSEQNFTDEQDSCRIEQCQKINVESTNKNSKINQSFEQNMQQEDQQTMPVADHLHKTAFFSFSEQFKTSPISTTSTQIHRQTQKQVDKNLGRNRISLLGLVNQQNYNNSNKLGEGKVEILLKMKKEQELRRRRAQYIMKEDRDFLSQIIGRK